MLSFWFYERGLCRNPGADPEFFQGALELFLNYCNILRTGTQYDTISQEILAINAIKVMRYLSFFFFHNIHNLFQFFVFLLQKEGCLATQYTPPPKSTPLTKTWNQRPTMLCGKKCQSSMTFCTHCVPTQGYPSFHTIKKLHTHNMHVSWSVCNHLPCSLSSQPQMQ